MATLRDFWPEEVSVNQVLRGDAEGHRDEVALAVHQPMRLLLRSYLDVQRSAAEAIDETRLLHDLLTPARDGVKLMLIEGDAGTGKSHVVRWLELQLRGLPDAGRRVILLIRKGTSLRAIVEEMLSRPELAGLRGADLTARLARAREPIDPERAAGMLCEELAAVCETMQKRAIEKRRSGQPMSPEDELDEGWGGLLPYLFRSQGLRRVFVTGDGPALRLVRHLGESASAPPEGREHSFVPEDLDLKEIPDELGKQEKQALSKLGKSPARKDAIGVLNRALDDAKRLLLGLDSTIIADVFRDIRRSLLRRDPPQELFLLVEDFADLSGIQGQLMQAAIHQGFDTTGTPEFCTLRTVLAYTPDYFKEQKQTVLSRAGVVYEIRSSDESIDDTRRRAASLIAAYLRAARVGVDRLRRAFDRRDTVGGDWIPDLGSVEAGDEEVLDAFGRVGDIPLFPFNEHAINALLDDVCRKGDQLPFIPRTIINQVMPRVLDHRASFVVSQFPDSTFVKSTRHFLGGAPSTWLLQQKAGPDRERLERVLLYWGTTNFASIAKAFHLPVVRGTPEELMPSEVAKPPGGGQVAAPVIAPLPPPTSPLRDLARWRSTFEDWSRGGAALKAPNDRQALREAVEVALRPALAREWQIMRDFKDVDFKKGRLRDWKRCIDVAGVDAEDATPRVASLVLATKEDREDATRKSLIAEDLALIASVAATKRNDWDFDGAEDVLIKYVSFVERHRPAATALLTKYWRGRMWDPVPWLMTQLERSGLALGIKDTEATDGASRVAALFERPPMTAPTGGSDWNDQTLSAMRALRTSGAPGADLPSWIDLLSDEIGAYQGSSGTSAHAIDVARLHPLFPSRARKAEPSPPVPVPSFPPAATEVPAIKSLLEGQTKIKDLAANAVRELSRRRIRAARLREWVGPTIRIDELAQELRTMKSALLAVHVMTADDGTALDDDVEAVAKLSLGRGLLAAERLPVPEASEREVLSALARDQVNAESLDRATTLLERIVGRMEEAEQRLRGLSSAVDPLEEALPLHSDALSQLISLVALAGAPS